MPMVFTAEVYTKPEVTLGEYKGLTVEVKPAESAKKYVDEEIKKILEQHARYVDVDRAAELGDKTIIDFVGTIDGVPFEGGSSEGEQLDIGSHMFIEGFEEQVIGMKAGEEKDINVTFPENYHAAELAGKPAVFHVKLNAVKSKEIPELDDEFAQDVSEFDTLEEYKEAYGSDAYGLTAFLLSKIRVYSIPFGFVAIIIAAIYQYIIGIKKLDVRDKGFALMIASVTIVVICQVLPLVFAIVVKGWRG